MKTEISRILSLLNTLLIISLLQDILKQTQNLVKRCKVKMECEFLVLILMLTKVKSNVDLKVGNKLSDETVNLF